MIEVNNLTFAFKKSKTAFNNISFSIDEGEVLCVLGPNGVGKTTLLKTVTGLYQPVSGSCHIGRVGNRKARMAYVPQAKRVHFSYNVLDFISFGCPLRGGMLASPGRGTSKKRREYCRDLALHILQPKTLTR